MLTRRIPKRVPPPPLSHLHITSLSQLCFGKEVSGTADLIFFFGTNTEHVKAALLLTSLLERGISRRLLITGGLAHYSDATIPLQIESEKLYSLLSKEEFPGVEFILERDSSNTLENVLYALELYDFSHAKRLIFVSQSFALGRSRLTLQRYLPHTELLQQNYDISVEGHGPLTKDNWYQTQVGRELVWGEFLRIVTYGRDGMIECEEIEPNLKRLLEKCR